MDVKELPLEEIRHVHPLKLVDLQFMHRDYQEDDDDYDDNDLIKTQNFKCLCNMCGAEIDWYHRYYYKCSISCDYTVHLFCANLPTTLQFQAHLTHILILKKTTSNWTCGSCLKDHKGGICYHCSICNYGVDLHCATFVEQKTIHHPSHPHPLTSVTVKPILSECFACGKKHKGDFYHCSTCLNYSVSSDCVSFPIKLLLDNDRFSHPHLLTLSYSSQDRLYDYDRDFECDYECRVCGVELEDEHLIYKCSKCMYYVHPDCATQRVEPFMSILLPGLGKTEKNFKDADHPNLIHYPLPDESYNMVSPHIIEEEGSTSQYFGQNEDENGHVVHFSHEHPLVLIHDKINNGTKSISLHDPMRRIKLLCNGCLRPITKTPFYKCSKEHGGCNFVLHEWCTRLRKELPNHTGHPQHKLELITTSKVSGFRCDLCQLPCNGFSYRCTSCDYGIDVNCGFIPLEITHEAHPDHLLTRVDASSKIECRACHMYIFNKELYFKCGECDFYLDIRCALLLPKTIRHKYDKHSLKLSYGPIEDHKSQYFCEICEVGLNPGKWFYHCIECAQSIHSACASLVLQSEQGVNSVHVEGVYKFVNIKFGVAQKVTSHGHPLVFSPGTKNDGSCYRCKTILQSNMILKCLQCKVARHYYPCIGYMFPEFFISRMDLFARVKRKKESRRPNIAFYPREITRPVTHH